MSESDENVRESVPSSSSSTSSDEDLPKHRKRKRSHKDEGGHKKSKVLEHLAEQVSQIQNYLASNSYPPPGWYPVGTEYHPPVVMNANNPAPSPLNEPTIEVPAESALQFNFDLTTNLKEPTILNASSDHLQLLNSLQHFKSENWTNVRYSEIQKSYNARPGFVELEVNDEIKQFDKANNLIATDRSLGAITHAVIMQSDALKTGVSELMQWVHDSDNVDKESMLVKIKQIFSGDFQKISLDCLQLLCGRRADIIEQRRDAFLNLVKDKFLKVTLKKIPPSCDFLFDKEEFSDFLKNNGGISKIFSKPSFSAQEKRVTFGSQAAQPGSSTYNQAGRPTAPFALRYQAPQGVRPYAPMQSYTPMQPYALNYEFPAYAGNQRLFRPQFKPQSFTAGQQAPANPRKPFNQQGPSSQLNAVRGRGKGGRKY